MVRDVWRWKIKKKAIKLGRNVHKQLFREVVKMAHTGFYTFITPLISAVLFQLGPVSHFLSTVLACVAGTDLRKV